MAHGVKSREGEPGAPLMKRAEEAAAAVRSAVPRPPAIAVVLGSGLNVLAERLESRGVVPYAEIPHFPVPSVAGHAGNLVAGTLGGAPLLILQGRFHYYEGHDLETVTFPVRVLRCLGVATLILTAATGSIREDLGPGDLLTISDHLNLLGQNPLRGLRDPALGSPFVDLTEVYSSRLRTIAGEQAARLGIGLSSGVYACLPGPSYETPAEIRMLRTLGADVVGMSVVPEAIVARHAGMEVLGLAMVSNAAAGVTGAAISHEEVLEAGRRAVPAVGALLEAVVGRLQRG